jgi:glycosidase
MNSIKDVDLSEITAGKKYWNVERPVEEEVMYFLLIDRFHDGKERISIPSTTGFGNTDQLQARCGGTIQGVIKNLKYISALGFTSIWINPFLQNNPETYHGYSIENFLEVDAQWGTKEDIVELVAQAHKLHIKVFFDIVLNHTGNNWSYVKENPRYNKGKQYAVKAWRYPDRPIPAELRNLNLYGRKGGIVKWEETPETWDGDIFELKDLIQDDSEIGHATLEILIAVYSYWFAVTDCDGFRIDAAKHIPPKWLNTFVDAMKALTASVHKTSFFIFAEIISNQSYISKYHTIDGYLDFDFHFSFVPNMYGEKKRKSAIQSQPRPVDKVPIRFLDNHDQVGQMPKHRIAYRMKEKALCNLLRAFLCMPGIPCIYYGTEQGLKGKGILDGSIRECLFNPDGKEDILNLDSPYARVIKEGIHLRKKLNLYTGDFRSCEIMAAKSHRCIALQVNGLASSKLIVYNLGPHNEVVSIKLSFPLTRTNKLVVYLYSNGDADNDDKTVVNDILHNITMHPYGFKVLELLNHQESVN